MSPTTTFTTRPRTWLAVPRERYAIRQGAMLHDRFGARILDAGQALDLIEFGIARMCWDETHGHVSPTLHLRDGYSIEDVREAVF